MIFPVPLDFLTVFSNNISAIISFVVARAGDFVVEVSL